jgi:xylulokinase
VCLPKDFIALNLTGVFATDVGDGSGTMLVDPSTRDWNPAVLDALAIDRGLLPRLLESGTVVGGVTTWAAAESGLPEGRPLAIGSGDNQAAAVGAGVVDPGEALAILGTSGVVLAPSPEPTVPTSVEQRAA